MKNYSRKTSIIKMIFFGLVAITGFSFALMLLWNWLMPTIFGLTTICFWQALGLLALSKILFGRGHSPHWNHRDKHKSHKELFMKRFGKKCFETQESENKD
jgi:hypothetical protein